MILNNPLNWILPWNEWMNHILNRYLPFLMKSPLFCLFWTLFGQFSGTFPIRPVSKSPWLLNWIIFWIESAEFFLNWIIFWIESWVKRYWIEYWMNHFLAKFKHWIESDRVSNTPTFSSRTLTQIMCSTMLSALREWKKSPNYFLTLWKTLPCNWGTSSGPKTNQRKTLPSTSLPSRT